MLRNPEGFYQYDHNGRTVVSRRQLGSYKVPLAVALADALPVPLNQAVKGAYLADILRQQGDGATDMFPDAPSRLAREMRVTRTLTEPVQVDGVVLYFHKAERGGMYEKTKTVVAKPGSLRDFVATETAPTPVRTYSRPLALPDAPLPSIAPEVRALSDNGVSARDALPVDVPAIKALVAAEVEARLVLEGVPSPQAYAASENDVLMRIEEVHRLARERDDKVAVWLNQARQSTGLSDLVFDGEPEPPSEALALVLHVDKMSRERDSRIQAAFDELKHAFHRRAS